MTVWGVRGDGEYGLMVPRSGMMLAALVRLRLGRRALKILCWGNLILLLYGGPGKRKCFSVSATVVELIAMSRYV